MVAAVGDELEPVAAVDEAVGEGERLQERRRGGAPRCRRRSRGRRGRSRRHRRRGRPSPTRAVGAATVTVRVVGVGGAERVLGQEVLGVHEQQLLVLLLVVAARARPGRDRPRRGRGGRRRPARRRRGGRRRPRRRSGGSAGRGGGAGAGARPPRSSCSRGSGIDGSGSPEHELVEEPGGVGPVPLRRRAVGHRLHDLVLGPERRGEGLGARPHGLESIGHGAPCTPQP